MNAYADKDRSYDDSLDYNEAVQAIFEQYKEDPDVCEEADADANNRAHGRKEFEARRLLASLNYKHPDDLLGSQLLTDLYRLGEEMAADREAILMDWAAEELDNRIREKREGPNP